MYYSEFVPQQKPDNQFEKIRKQSVKTEESETKQYSKPKSSFLRKILLEGEKKFDFDLLNVHEKRYYDSLVRRPRANSEILLKPSLLLENNYVKTRKLSQIANEIDLQPGNNQQSLDLIMGELAI